jgi:hypothetical protein
MIERLRLRNFRRHRDATLRFQPGVGRHDSRCKRPCRRGSFLDAARRKSCRCSSRAGTAGRAKLPCGNRGTSAVVNRRPGNYSGRCTNSITWNSPLAAVWPRQHARGGVRIHSLPFRGRRAGFVTVASLLRLNASVGGDEMIGGNAESPGQPDHRGPAGEPLSLLQAAQRYHRHPCCAGKLFLGHRHFLPQFS